MDYLRYNEITYGPFLEEWKDMIGYEGIYKISNYGRVKSLANGKVKRQDRCKKEKILKPVKSAGRIIYSLHKNNIANRLYAHRLVAIHFIPNPENKSDVNHIRGYTDDNVFTQLEWNTRAENNMHAYEILNKKCPFGTVRNEEIISKCVKNDKITIYKNIAEVLKCDVTKSAIYRCLNKQVKKHKGKEWYYKNDFDIIKPKLKYTKSIKK